MVVDLAGFHMNNSTLLHYNPTILHSISEQGIGDPNCSVLYGVSCDGHARIDRKTLNTLERRNLLSIPNVWS